MTALAATTGPGSFTGVRIALSTLKGMALGLSQPPQVIGLPTLAVTAAPWLTVAGSVGSPLGADVVVCAYLQAGRGRYNWAYVCAGGRVAATRPGGALRGDRRRLCPGVGRDGSPGLAGGRTRGGPGRCGRAACAGHRRGRGRRVAACRGVGAIWPHGISPWVTATTPPRSSRSICRSHKRVGMSEKLILRSKATKNPSAKCSFQRDSSLTLGMTVPPVI